MGEDVGRTPPARSPPRGASAPPQTRSAGIDRLQRVVRPGEQLQVGRRRRVRAVGRELRQPEAVEVRLVADDHVVERRQRPCDRGRVLRELGLRRRVERRRRRAGVVDGDVDLHARETGGGLDVAEDLELSGRRREEARTPVRRDPHGREAGEPEPGHRRLRGDEIRGPDVVLGRAESHRRPCGLGGKREGEERGEDADQGREGSPHGRGTLARVHEDSVRSQLGKLPRGPGVYLFRGDRDEVLYVGKAKSLRARVRSYFNRGADMRVGIDRMVDRIRRHRGDRHAERGRGAAPRAEPRQAPPAAVQRPAARRQVVPVHRGHRRRRVSARDVHPRAAPARHGLLRPVREREEGARDARRAQSRLPVPAVRGAEARAATRASRASTSTSSAARRRASARSPRRTTGRSSTA